MTDLDRRIDSQRFVLEPLSDGAMLLDLGSGVIFQLNRTAGLIWRLVLSGVDVATVGEQVSATYGLPAATVRRDLEQTLAIPEAYPGPTVSPPYHYEVVGQCYRFSDAQHALLEVDPERQVVRALREFDPATVGLYLSSLTPKMASLLGASVVHASAVASPRGAATLFLGESGAGKTTTARALAAANTGWRLVSEDKVILRMEGTRVAAVADGERRILSWIADAKGPLSGGADRSYEAGALASAVTGAAYPVDRVVLVDRTRRAPGPLQLSLLGQTTAAREIFRAGFYGSEAAEAWRRDLGVTAALARTASTYEATVPEGLGALAEMARGYAETTTS